MARKRIGIVDYGSGNFGSTWNAVSFFTPDALRINNPAHITECSHVIIPGVGAFGAVMEKLDTLGFLQTLVDQMRCGYRHFLGICVGMQILASTGYEFGESAGLDIIKGKVIRIDVDATGYSLPHMGWNTISDIGSNPLFAGMDKEPSFYFLHSYHFVPSEEKIAIAFTDYGIAIAAAISKGTVHGVQFHPEKSQDYGLQLLNNFFAMDV